MGKGDEHVRIIVDIPKNVTSEQKQLLKEFDKTYVPPKNSGKEGKAVCIFKYTHFCMFMRKKPQKI